MPNSDQLLARAVALHQQGRLPDAEAAYLQLLRADNNHADGLRLLGCLYLQMNQAQRAAAYLAQAKARRPNDAEILNNLGIAVRNLGRLDEAAQYYREALAVKPDYPQAAHNLGSVCYQEGHLDEAQAHYERALQLEPNYAQAHYNLGNVLRDKDKQIAAIGHYQQALRLQPGYIDAMINLALSFAQINDVDRALAVYRDALRLQPNHVLVMNNFGNLLRRVARFEEAKKLYEHALQVQPDYANAHINLGTVLRDLGDLDGALRSYQEALRLNPNSTAAMSNLGTLMQDFGRLEEAQRLYDQALTIEPGSIEALWNMALVHLSLGDYTTGWKLYEIGLGVADKRGPMPFLPATLWDGSDFTGKRLLLWAEQGFGDGLQFVRYAKMCKQRGGEVYVLCPAPLAALFKNDPNIDKVFTKIEPQDYDLHISMMSLPAVFGTTVETIPAEVPYLYVSAAARLRWAHRFTGDGSRLRVGLVWAGGIREHQPFMKLIDQRRSMQLEQFRPLLAIEGVDFYTLQIGPPAAQIAACGLADRLIDLTGAIKDFEDTAALVEHLDLVIAVDTSIVHLAGGLGKPVWVLSRFDACWRWLRNRADSPWYPTARVFGQNVARNWGDVVSNVCKELKAFIEAKS